jgi:hypothetical protein
MEVVCADVGSVKCGNFGWFARLSDGTERKGSDIHELAVCVAASRARGRSGNPAVAAAAERRSEVSRYEAADSGGEALQRSTRSPGGGAMRRRTGVRPYSLKAFCGDHVERYKKRAIYWLIISPKVTMQALTCLHRYNRDTVNRFPGGYLRPYRQKLEAKRESADYILTGGGSSQGERTINR